MGTVEKYGTKTLAQKAVEALLLKLNSETPQQAMAVVTFGEICDRYLEEELPERYSTAKSYRSNIKNYLKPRWGDYLLEKIRPMAVEDWLKNLSMASKSKALRDLHHRAPRFSQVSLRRVRTPLSWNARRVGRHLVSGAARFRKPVTALA